MEKKKVLKMIVEFFGIYNLYLSDFQDVFSDYCEGARYDDLDKTDLNNFMYALMGLACSTYGVIPRETHLKVVNLVEMINQYLEG